MWLFLIGNPNGKIAGNKTGITKWRGASCLVAIVVFPGEMLFTYISASWSQRKKNCLFLLSFGGFLSILSSHYTRWRCCGSWQRICWGLLHALRCLAPVACSWERREHKVWNGSRQWNTLRSSTSEFNCSLRRVKAGDVFRKNKCVYIRIHRKP